MSLRIVGLNAFLPGFRLVHEFAVRNGHELALVVTLPQTTRYGASDPMVAGVPEDVNVLITRKLRTVAAPVIAALRPDVVISAAFPRLIPGEILEIPKYGAVNCHPSPLPAGRGPTPQRLIYEGDERVAATVHRTAAEFDTGAILAQRVAPLPDDLNGTGIMASWRTLLSECLDEAVPRLVAGDPGEPQDASAASEAPFFTDAERILDLTEPAHVIRRKAAALNVTAPTAQLPLNGTTHLITRTDPADPAAPAGTANLGTANLDSAGPASRGADRTPAPGTVLEEHPDGWTVQTADHPLRLTRA